VRYDHYSWHYRFSKFIRRSTSVLPWERLKDVPSYEVSEWTKQHCVARNMLLANYGLGRPATAPYSNLCRIDTGLVPQYRHESGTQIKISLRTSSRGPNSSSSSPTPRHNKSGPFYTCVLHVLHEPHAPLHSQNTLSPCLNWLVEWDW